ncbi:MAG: hypothetical protein PHH06_01620 [Candidatus Gracilibacteria bacterium]|nr:hypothetical protein [Candidatus Gracilibacteria bacterium]
MLEKIIKILLVILLFSIAFINSHLFDLVGIKLDFLYVNGNFEFTKVIYFNILSSFIIFLYFIKSFFSDREIKVPLFITFIFIILILSTLFSISPLVSFFGDNSKGHGLIMLINLLGLFIVINNQKKEFTNILIKTFIFSAFFISILGIWQYYIPSFDYGDLGNRAISSLGHPNYLVLFLLLSIPFLLNKIFNKKNYKYLFVLITITICLFLTKSVWGIIIFILYCTYILNHKFKFIKNNYIFFITTLIILISIGITVFFTYPEKLQSFISRFFIWSSTLDLIFLNPKNFLFGYGFDTLSLTFEKSKSIYLYIFENIGFTADRPHNILLNIFYHTGFLGISLFGYTLYIFIKYLIKEKKIKNEYYTHTIIIFFIFTILNFASIVSYLVFLLFVAKFTKKVQIKYIEKVYLKYSLMLIISFISIVGLYSSYNFYKAETYAFNKLYEKSIEIFKYNPDYYYSVGQYDKGLKYGYYKGEFYFYSKISSKLIDIENNCTELTKNFPSPENYFYCGELLEYLGKNDLALYYYKNGLHLLPDLWNKDSNYYDNLFIKKFIDGKRFFSEKYSNLNSILEKVKNN